MNTIKAIVDSTEAMRYLSVCSGIEAATVAWKPLNWEVFAFSEIEKFPSAVLEYHYPETPNLGDMNDFKKWPDANVDVLVGGTPCQSFSVAGLRAGMEDPRGNLALTFCAILGRYRPAWFVWENVPGVLSSNGGRDFGALIGAMVKLGYGIAYRVLDAQYFGVPQRRRRVFVVGYLGDWRRAAEVLFEPESLLRNPPPSRETGKAAPTIPSRSTAGGGLGTDFDCDEGLIPETVGALTDGAHNGGGLNGQDAYSGRIFPVQRPVGALTAKGPEAMGAPEVDAGHYLAFAQNQRDEVRMMDKAGTLAAEPGVKQQTSVAYETGQGFWQHRQQTGTLRAEGENRPSRPSNVVQSGIAVRRLTPLECERLQGFPDGYTDTPGASDSGRYKALGNSMAVPVMHWIGKRIDSVQQSKREND